MAVRTVIERGPKGKRSVAFSIDWPGWSRGAKTADDALAALESYRARYRPVAQLAKMTAEFDAAGPLDVVEDKVGTGSTDFWAISFSASAAEQEPMDEADLERGNHAPAGVLDVLRRRSRHASLRRCARGRGEADATVTASSATSFATRARISRTRSACGFRRKGALTPDALRKYRRDYVAAMRAYNAGEVTKRMRSWTLAFLIRHSAFHNLDHAWEMEDKDLSAAESA